jgi:hypothetical protein
MYLKFSRTWTQQCLGSAQPAESKRSSPRDVLLMKIGETKLNLAEMQPNRLSSRCAGFGLILWTSGANRRFQFHKRRQLHSLAQRTAVHRRDVRQQSRSFARWNQSLRRSPNSNPALLRLSAMISQYFTLPDCAAFALHKTMIFSRCVSQSSHLN